MAANATKGDKVEGLLVAILLQLMKGATNAQRISQLSVVGYTNVEIANFMQLSSGAVNQAIYVAKTAVNKTKKKA
jgi:hypothetical protein